MLPAVARLLHCKCSETSESTVFSEQLLHKSHNDWSLSASTFCRLASRLPAASGVKLRPPARSSASASGVRLCPTSCAASDRCFTSFSAFDKLVPNVIPLRTVVTCDTCKIFDVLKSPPAISTYSLSMSRTNPLVPSRVLTCVPQAGIITFTVPTLDLFVGADGNNERKSRVPTAACAFFR